MKVLKTLGILLLIGFCINVGNMVGGTLGDLITVLGAVVGVAAIVKILGKKNPIAQV